MKKKKMKVVAILLLMLGMIIISGQTAQAKSIKLDKKNFPCKDIRTYAKKHYDKNKDGKLSEKELKKATKIKNKIIFINSAKELNCLTKLKYLQEIDELRLKNNKSIQELAKLKKLKKLVAIDISGGLKNGHYVGKKLTKVNLKAFKNLREVNLDAPIKKLDVSRNGKLTSISLSGTKIKKISLKKMKNLKILGIGVDNKEMDSVDVEDCKKLEGIGVYTAIEKLNINGCDKIEWYAIKNTRLQQVCLSNMRYLEYVRIEKNVRPESIVIKDCPKLEYISVDEGNSLKELMICNNNRLNELWLTNISVQSCVQISGISNVIVLGLQKSENSILNFDELNGLKEFNYTGKVGQKIPEDIFSMPTIEKMFVWNESVTKEINIEAMTNLKNLRWEKGVLENIILTDKSKMEHMDLSDNNLSGDWDLSEYINLQEFRCDNNHISTINACNLEKLFIIDCKNNNLTKLDLYWVKGLHGVLATGNPNAELFLPYTSYGDGYCEFDKSAKVHYNPRLNDPYWP